MSQENAPSNKIDLELFNIEKVSALEGILYWFFVCFGAIRPILKDGKRSWSPCVEHEIIKWNPITAIICIIVASISFVWNGAMAFGIMVKAFYIE